MQYRKLGDSDLYVSVLAFGAWQIGDPGYWGVDAEADAQAAVDAAIDAGINLFDTAESYGGGESERALGKALGAKRKDVLIATKVSPSNCAPEKLRRSCEASLGRLGTDVIDLYQIHWPFRDVPVAEIRAELQRLHEEGKIRAAGVSNFGPGDLEAWMAHGSCASNQVGYNLLFRAIEYEIVPACLAYGVGILAYMPLLQGILSGRWRSVEEIPEARRRTRHFADTRQSTRHGEPGCEAMTFDALRGLQEIADGLGQPLANVAMAWLLAQPGVTSVIVGARNPHQVTRNVAAADLALPGETARALSAVTGPLKQHFGTNADMWVGGDGSRIR